MPRPGPAEFGDLAAALRSGAAILPAEDKFFDYLRAAALRLLDADSAQEIGVVLQDMNFSPEATSGEEGIALWRAQWEAGGDAIYGVFTRDGTTVGGSGLHHRSAEPGHARLLEKLGKQPLFDFGMRLGEGSGAAMAAGVVKAAADLHNNMATFQSAGVSNKEA